MDFNTLSRAVYIDNVAAGWWPDGKRPDIMQVMQLISRELSEATEGERQDLPDEHLPHRKMAEVELADALLRTLDLAGRFGWRYVPGEPHKAMQLATSPAAMHLVCNMALSGLASLWLQRCRPHWMGVGYSSVVDTILDTAERCGYDIHAAMKEKRAYNKTRADHTLEERAKPHGKGF